MTSLFFLAGNHGEYEESSPFGCKIQVSKMIYLNIPRIITSVEASIIHYELVEKASMIFFQALLTILFTTILNYGC